MLTRTQETGNWYWLPHSRCWGLMENVSYLASLWSSSAIQGQIPDLELELNLPVFCCCSVRTALFPEQEPVDAVPDTGFCSEPWQSPAWPGEICHLPCERVWNNQSVLLCSTLTHGPWLFVCVEILMCLLLPKPNSPVSLFFFSFFSSLTSTLPN